MTVAVQRYRFTVDDYYQMGKTGILREDDRVELINGEIIQMSPIGGSHAYCVNMLVKLFSSLYQQNYMLCVQNPIHLNEYNEPQPDFVIVDPSDLAHTKRHPQPEDILLLIEVSDSTVKYDKQVKIPLYAEFGIKEAWCLDLNNSTLETFRQPTPTGYQAIQTYQSNQPVSPLAFPGMQMTTEQIMNP